MHVRLYLKGAITKQQCMIAILSMRRVKEVVGDAMSKKESVKIELGWGSVATIEIIVKVVMSVTQAWRNVLKRVELVNV